jgi:hypothetical protein
MIGLILALASLVVWLNLWLFRGRFWDTAVAPEAPPPAAWPGVVVVIPARNEAEGIGATVGSLLRQAYPGRLQVVVVDDQSTDGTAVVAQAAAAAAGAADRLTVIPGTPLPPGWVGKMWAVSQGVATAERIAPDAHWVLLTDGDITHGPGNLAQLVARGEADGLDLVSLMVRLRCRAAAERWLIPPFVFFFNLSAPHPGRHGGWPLLHDGAFDISASVKAYFALKMIGDDRCAAHGAGARGDPGARRRHQGNVFTRILLALFGVTDLAQRAGAAGRDHAAAALVSVPSVKMSVLGAHHDRAAAGAGGAEAARANPRASASMNCSSAAAAFDRHDAKAPHQSWGWFGFFRGLDRCCGCRAAVSEGLRQRAPSTSAVAFIDRAAERRGRARRDLSAMANSVMMYDGAGQSGGLSATAPSRANRSRSCW